MHHNPLQCDNCGWIGHSLQADLPADLHERMDEGGEPPAADCPRCGAFAYTMRNSLFHLFQNAEWTSEDQQAAQAMGWDLFDVDSRGILQVEAVGEAGRFKTDAEAAAYVAAAAGAGNGTAQRALLHIARTVLEGYLSYRGIGPRAVVSLSHAFELGCPTHEETLLRAAYGT